MMTALSLAAIVVPAILSLLVLYRQAHARGRRWQTDVFNTGAILEYSLQIVELNQDLAEAELDGRAALAEAHTAHAKQAAQMRTEHKAAIAELQAEHDEFAGTLTRALDIARVRVEWFYLRCYHVVPRDGRYMAIMRREPQGGTVFFGNLDASIEQAREERAA